MKVTIIGAGSVGATIGYTLAVQGTASEIVFVDINKEKALGEAMDIVQGAPFVNPMNVIAGDYPDAKDSDVVVITSGIPRKAGQSRLELAQVNVNVMKDIASKITPYAPNATYIIVSNPVDVMTYVFHKVSGIPESKIIGSGTILDTSRLRTRIAEIYGVSQNNVHAYVFGEHGDSSFVTWSLANIANVPLDQYSDHLFGAKKEIPEYDREEVADFVRKSGGIIIGRKGATFYAIAISVAYIIKCLTKNVNTTMTVSTMMHGEYGIDGCCLSTLAIVGPDGVVGSVEVPLTEDEMEKLRKSADNLKSVINSLEL